MSEQKTVTGVRESVEIKNDWHTFAVNVGRDYPVKLSTKKKSLIEEALAFRADEILEWVYIEKESDRINEKSGKPYVNRWLEEVHAATSSERAVGQGHASSAGGPSGSEAVQPPSQSPARSVDVRGESIERQVVIKAALPAYVEMFVKSPAEFWVVCDLAAEWIANQKPSTEQVQAQAPAGSTFVDLDDVPFDKAVW